MVAGAGKLRRAMAAAEMVILLGGPCSYALDLGAAQAQLEPCARLLLESRGGGHREDLMSCRVPLLGSLHEDSIPGYKYNATDDCHFWAHYAARDRTVEGSRVLDFNRLAAYRLLDPFNPPLQSNGTALYIGAHRGGEDGLEFHRRFKLQMHLFEPSPTFFRNLYETLAGVPGFTLHNYGLGAKTYRTRLRLSGTASRTVDENEVDPETEPVLIRAATEAIPELLSTPAPEVGRSPRVELLHVNCEGCEYDVIEGLRKAGQLSKMAQVQVATHLLEYNEPGKNWHETVEASLQVSVKRYCEMHRTLSLTHERVWGLPWVWERWTRRQATT